MGWWDDDNAKMGWWDDDNANIGWWDDGFLLEFYKITIHPILASPSSHHPILASNLLRCHDYTHTSLEYYLYYYTGVKRPLPQSSVRRARVTFRGSRTLSEEGGVSKPCMRTRWFTRFLRKYPAPSEFWIERDLLTFGVSGRLTPVFVGVRRGEYFYTLTGQDLQPT